MSSEDSRDKNQQKGEAIPEETTRFLDCYGNEVETVEDAHMIWVGEGKEDDDV